MVALKHSIALLAGLAAVGSALPGATGFSDGGGGGGGDSKGVGRGGFGGQGGSQEAGGQGSGGMSAKAGGDGRDGGEGGGGGRGNKEGGAETHGGGGRGGGEGGGDKQGGAANHGGGSGGGDHSGPGSGKTGSNGGEDRGGGGGGGGGVQPRAEGGGRPQGGDKHGNAGAGGKHGWGQGSDQNGAPGKGPPHDGGEGGRPHRRDDDGAIHALKANINSTHGKVRLVRDTGDTTGDEAPDEEALIDAVKLPVDSTHEKVNTARGIEDTGKRGNNDIFVDLGDDTNTHLNDLIRQWGQTEQPQKNPDDSAPADDPDDSAGALHSHATRAKELGALGVWECSQEWFQSPCSWTEAKENECYNRRYGDFGSMSPDKGLRCKVYERTDCNMGHTSSPGAGDWNQVNNFMYPGASVYQNDYHLGLQGMDTHGPVSWRCVGAAGTET